MQHIAVYFTSLIDHVGYLGLFVAMALGNIGAPIGSEVVLPAAGALVATGHLSNLWLTIAVAVIGELTGASAGYAIGRYGGRPFIHKYGPYVRFHEKELAYVDGFFAKYGSFAIFLCRFIPVIRGIVSIPAGICRMPLVPFYLWYAVGSLGFCGILIYLGNVLGNHLDQVVPQLHRYATAILVAAVVIAVTYLLLAWRRKKLAST
ncbi:MAG: DedA family protein [Candidatus Eremiobacteraeota bacterium]|nr:DedA family protein [Candidatus Eremiobacteraeota bacterium]